MMQFVESPAVALLLAAWALMFLAWLRQVFVARSLRRACYQLKDDASHAIKTAHSVTRYAEGLAQRLRAANDTSRQLGQALTAANALNAELSTRCDRATQYARGNDAGGLLALFAPSPEPEAAEWPELDEGLTLEPPALQDGPTGAELGDVCVGCEAGAAHECHAGPGVSEA